MIVAEKLDQMLARHTAIETEMARGPDPEDYVRLASEHSELGPVVEKIKEFREALSNLEGAEELLADA
ncbi:MAG: peptide chain release factor 1, partial [Pseudomonadota bacterium]